MNSLTGLWIGFCLSGLISLCLDSFLCMCILCRDVGSNSIQCTSCQKLVHNKYSGIKGTIYKVMKSFVCRGWSNSVTSTGRTSVDIGASANLELVDTG